MHEEFISPSYEFVKNNLQGSKEPLTRIVLEDSLRSRCNVQLGGEKGRMLWDIALFVFGSKAGRIVSHGGGCGRTNKDKLDSRGRS